MNYQELQDKIWECTHHWIHKSAIHHKIGGDRKKCFDTIKLMIPVQLKEKKIGNRIYVKRIDTHKRAEFEFGLTFQENMLKGLRDYLKNYPKPLFYEADPIVHYIPAITHLNIKEFRKAYKRNMKNPKGFKLDEVIKIWKTRKKNVKKVLENMRFYYTGLFIFISRAQLQKSLGIISTKEANIRIKKCQIALEKHFNILLKENPKDSEAIRQFHEFGYLFQNPVYDLGKFRI